MAAGYNWKDYLDRSYYFYEAQRSGALPADNRVKWRKDSCLNDTGPLGQSLVGGHFDSGGKLLHESLGSVASSAHLKGTFGSSWLCERSFHESKDTLERLERDFTVSKSEAKGCQVSLQPFSSACLWRSEATSLLSGLQTS